MIVMKFGGSSVESASAIERAAEIVKDHLHRFPVVVVSAMGGTTDRLLDAAGAAARGNSYATHQHLEFLRNLHFQETRKLLGSRAEPFLRDCIAPLFRDLHCLLIEVTDGRALTPRVQDEALSYGERLSSLIVAEAFRHMGINAAQVDARRLIVTGDQFTHAEPHHWETYARLRRSVALVARDRVVVMGGFIASTSSGVTTTLGRGGSDLTATLVGAGITAEEVQIWSDVNGILSCDPRLLAGGLTLPDLSYSEAQEMARLGAKVLCPTSIAPVLRQRIPIVIRNSRNPLAPGTRITSVCAAPGAVKSLNSNTGMALVHLNVDRPGILSSLTDSLADLFAGAQVAVEMIQVREGGISFALRNWPGLPAILRQVDSAVRIQVREDCAAVWLVGEDIARPEVLLRASAALGPAPILLTAQGSARLTVGFVIPETALQTSLAALHREFFPVQPSPLREEEIGKVTAPVVPTLQRRPCFS